MKLLHNFEGKKKRMNYIATLHNNILYIRIAYFCIALAFISCFFTPETPTVFPIICFGAITAIFAYKSYLFTKEKFRIDLREKRIPSFLALQDIVKAILLGQGIHFFDHNELGRNKYAYRINTEIIYKVSEKIESLKMENHNSDKPTFTLREDIYLLYGTEVHNALQNIEASLFNLENFLPKCENSYPTAQEIQEYINPALENLINASKALSESLHKCMYFGEYSK